MSSFAATDEKHPLHSFAQTFPESRMPGCCVRGCRNRNASAEATFYRIPRQQPGRNHAVRRRLWLDAIRSANGDAAEISGLASVCSEHFISGKASLDCDSPDFAPSVFTLATRSPRKHRKRSPHQKTANLESEETLQGHLRPVILLSRIWKETTLSDASGRGQIVALDVKKGVETAAEEAEAETHSSDTVEAPPQRTTASPLKLPADVPDLDKMNPALHLKRFNTPAGVFHCDRCDQGFSDVPRLVGHVQRWHSGGGGGAYPPRDMYEDAFSSEASSPEHQSAHRDELLLPCNMCDRSFTTHQSLKRHKLLHVRDGRKCGTCRTLFCRRHNHVVFTQQVESEIKMEDEEDEEEDEDEEDAPAAEPESLGGALKEEPKLSDDNDGSNDSDDDDDGSSDSDDDDDGSSDSDDDSSSDCDGDGSDGGDGGDGGGGGDEDEGSTWKFLPLLSVYAQIQTPAPGPPEAPPPPSDSLPAIPLPLLVHHLINPQHQFKPKPAAGDAPFLQPHLPMWPDLPPSLQLFSPQRLTSTFLEVDRNHSAICRERNKVDEVEEDVDVEEVEEVEEVTDVTEAKEPAEKKKRGKAPAVPSKGQGSREQERKKGVTDFIFVL